MLCLISGDVLISDSNILFSDGDANVFADYSHVSDGNVRVSNGDHL